MEKQTRENYTNINNISLLFKIKHIQLLIEKIFPFVTNRPIILPYLINKEPLLKKNLIKAFKSLKKINNLSFEINNIFYKFKAYRFLSEQNYSKYLDNYEYFIQYINKFYNKGISNNLNDDIIMDIYGKIFTNIFVIEKRNTHNLPNGKELENFIIDYFYLNKKFFLFLKYNQYINNNIITFFQKLNYNNIEMFEINLICIIDQYYDDEINIDLLKYVKLDSIYFSLTNDLLNIKRIIEIFIIIEKYIVLIKNLKKKIKKIIFDYTFTKNYSSKYPLLLYLIDEIKKNNHCHNLDVEEIKVLTNNNDPYTKYQQFNMRYTLNYFISKKAWFNLIIITPDDFNNIKNLNKKEINNLKNKINKFDEEKKEEEEKEEKDEKNDMKILLIDFQNNSPYQENFIYFCHNYLGINDIINTVVIHNIGNINYDINCYNKIKNKKPEIYFSNLINLFYENNNIKNNKIKENEIKEFLDLFFFQDNLIYLITITDNNNYLLYLFMSDEIDYKSIISTNIFNQNNIILNIYFDNIKIKYELSSSILHIIKINNNVINSNTFSNIQNISQNINNLISKIKYENIDKDIIKEINTSIDDSNIIKDKSQYDIIFKKLIEQNNNIFRLRKINKEIYKKLKKSKKKRLMIIKTKQGHIFGAYNTFSHKIKKGFNKGFIFDIVNQEIFETNEDDYGYCQHEFCGVNNYFHITKKNPEDNYFLGKRMFDVSNIEVYGIQFLKIYEIDNPFKLFQ